MLNEYLAETSNHLNDALGQAKEDRDRAREADRDGKHKLFASYIAEANGNRFSGGPGQRFASIEPAFEVIRLDPRRFARVRPAEQPIEKAQHCHFLRQGPASYHS